MLQDLRLVFDFDFQNALLVLFVVLLTGGITDSIEGFFLGFPVLFLLEALLFFAVVSGRWCWGLLGVFGLC